MRFIAYGLLFLAVVSMAFVLNWFGDEYSWHVAVAPTVVVIYAIMVAVTLKPRAPKKVVKKQ